MTKDGNIVIRAEKKDIESFKKAVESQDKTMAKVLRNFIKEYGGKYGQKPRQ